jgi:hypothetical protein
MTITVEVSDRYILAFAVQYKYPEQINDPNNRDRQIPNTQTKDEFFKEKIKQYLDDIFITQEVRKKAAAARLAEAVDAQAYVVDNVTVT